MRIKNKNLIGILFKRKKMNFILKLKVIFIIINKIKIKLNKIH